MRERGTRGGRRAAGFAVLLVVFVASAAQGQSAVPAPQGIKLGDGRLHPSIAFGATYDSLIGYFEGTAANPIPSGELIFAVRPGVLFDLTTPSTQVLFNGYGEGLLYSGLMAPNSRDLSRIQANVSFDAAFNKTGAAEFQLGDTLIRSDRTQNAAVGVGVISLFNVARLAVPIHPGGRALEVTPKAAFNVELFDPLLTGTIVGCAAGDISCDPARVQEMNYWTLTGGLSARWKFLPKTAVTLDAAFDWRNYIVNQAANRQGQVLRVQAGLMGLISPRIAVTLLAGYGGDFAGNYHAPIGQAEFAYIPSEISKLAVGYVRTVQPVPLHGTYSDDRPYLTGKLGLLGGRLSLTAQAQYDYLGFLPNGAAAARFDSLITGNAGVSFDVTSWFVVAGGYQFSFRDSNATSLALNNVRHVANLNLTFRY